MQTLAVLLAGRAQRRETPVPGSAVWRRKLMWFRETARGQEAGSSSLSYFLDNLSFSRSQRINCFL